ncbi:hypothetical protein [Paraburkholderia sp. BCC1884]|uniref:hypothetical protein n=1 Tax=Paraburkholderia sp. BCC1884 TaxID=2562668 RepID=UPI0011832A5D|nr:hypothetical protein [Paraburkholderia sp. BCC1884]
MKIRILSIACVTTAAALLAACTAVYKNSDACEQLTRSKLAETSTDTLKIAHTGAGIDGSRVVVEGAIDHVMSASEVAAVAAASAVKAASAPVAGSGASAAAAASGAVLASASGVRAASATTATTASSSAKVAASVAASAPVSASGVVSAAEIAAVKASLKSGKPPTVSTPAAAECTYHGATLNLFSWLAPEKLAVPADQAASAVN